MGDKKLDSFPCSRSGRTRVVIGDPYPVIVHGLRTMVESDRRFQVVAGTRTMRSFQRKIITERPEVGLVDWAMASEDLPTTASLLKSCLCSTSIIFLAVPESVPQKQEMLRLGAHAFLSKWTSARKLQAAILKACKGRVPLESSGEEADVAGSRSFLSAADAEQRIKELTYREYQLLPLVCSGLKNKEIALQLGIAESTVWHHLTSVFTKLQVEDRLGLATFAYGHNLIFPDAQSRRRDYPGSAKHRDKESLRPRTLKFWPASDLTDGGQENNRLNGSTYGAAAGA
jgi:two-component system, NarL family, nitrate/nitrite response regulator NarL